MYRCPKCMKQFKTWKELRYHFNQEAACRWFALDLVAPIGCEEWLMIFNA